MKNSIFVSLLLLSTLANSQSFEGTVRWSMKMDFTDPKMKAQLEQGMQQLKDPAVQAQMKEMQEKMNDPQMKAMMDANPQMKAQMESAMKMMQGGGATDMSSMMPKGFILKVKGGNTLAIMEGGVMPMEILTLKDQNKTIRLDRKNKTYSVMQNPGAVESGAVQRNTPSVKVSKTTETTKLLGYTCTKYIASVTENDETINQVYWTTTEIKDFDLKNLNSQRFGRGGQQMFYEGIEGVPLKMELTMQEAKMTMLVEEIKKEALRAEEFSIPKDFKETQGNFFSK
jgi:hypothetical protein